MFILLYLKKNLNDKVNSSKSDDIRPKMNKVSSHTIIPSRIADNGERKLSHTNVPLMHPTLKLDLL